MKLSEFLVGLARAYAKEKNVQVAFFWHPQQNRVLGVGTHVGAASDTWETAIVNVTQALRGQQVSLSDAWCISSYLPTEMCKGMLSVCSVKSRLWSQPAAAAGAGPEIKTEKAGSSKDPFVFTKNAGAVVALPVPVADEDLNLLARVRALKAAANLTDSATAALDGLFGAVAITRRTMPAQPLLGALLEEIPPPPLKDIASVDVFQCLAMAIVGMTWNPKPAEGWNTQSADEVRLAGREPRRAHDYGELFGGNNVGAVVVHKGEIIAWGLNVMAQNSTFHAETLAIQTYLHRTGVSRLPQGSVVYSSLQPCHMCAGFIAHVGYDTRVIYAMRDATLETVLSGVARPNGCTEMVFSTAGQVLDLIKDVNTELAKRAAGPTTARLKDTQDLALRAGFIAGARTAPSEFGAALQQELRALRRVPARRRSNGQRQRLERLERQRLERLEWEERAVPGELGLQFTKFGGHLLALARAPGTGAFRKKTVEHCLELLKHIGAAGLSTRYGLDLVMELFDLKPGDP